MPPDSGEIFGLSEPVLRLSVFIGVLGLLIALEFLLPRKRRVFTRAHRWWTNGLMLILATLLMRGAAVLTPLLIAAATATYAETNGIGLFNLTGWPLWLEIILAIILLDFAIWFQHLISHKVPILWRVHKVHHSDRDLDTTSALRFHPIEILLSAAYKVAIVLCLGPAVVAVILFEILLNACAMFNHANIALPRTLDALIRSVLVTPDMHRIHHSVHRDEHDTNYGFCLSVWDRALRTYTAQPKEGHEEMRLGLAFHQSDNPRSLGWSLWLPFK